MATSILLIVFIGEDDQTLIIVSTFETLYASSRSRIPCGVLSVVKTVPVIVTIKAIVMEAMKRKEKMNFCIVLVDEVNGVDIVDKVNTVIK